MIYGLYKEQDGSVKYASSWMNEQKLPAGYTSCTEEEYAAAIDAMRNSLRQQAAIALSSIRAYVNYNYTIMNAAIPDDIVAYIKAITAIANGTDTTSTTLPTAPATS